MARGSDDRLYQSVWYKATPGFSPAQLAAFETRTGPLFFQLPAGVTISEITYRVGPDPAGPSGVEITRWNLRPPPPAQNSTSTARLAPSPGRTAVDPNEGTPDGEPATTAPGEDDDTAAGEATVGTEVQPTGDFVQQLPSATNVPPNPDVIPVRGGQPPSAAPSDADNPAALPQPGDTSGVPDEVTSTTQDANVSPSQHDEDGATPGGQSPASTVIAAPAGPAQR